MVRLEADDTRRPAGHRPGLTSPRPVAGHRSRHDGGDTVRRHRRTHRRADDRPRATLERAPAVAGPLRLTRIVPPDRCQIRGNPKMSVRSTLRTYKSNKTFRALVGG